MGQGWTGMDGVGQAGQGWTGLDGVGRGWTGLDGVGRGWTGFNWVGWGSASGTQAGPGFCLYSISHQPYGSNGI